MLTVQRINNEQIVWNAVMFGDFVHIYRTYRKKSRQETGNSDKICKNPGIIKNLLLNMMKMRYNVSMYVNR